MSSTGRGRTPTGATDAAITRSSCVRFRSRPRRGPVSLRRMRRRAASSYPALWRCYTTTYRRHHSTPYLSLEFFERLGTALPDNVLLVLGECEGRPVCSALDLFSRDTLWGRYWGSTEFLPGLHFEACYYQAIEF